MKNKKIQSFIAIIAISLASTSFVACSSADKVKQSADDAKKQIEQSANDTKSKAQDGSDTIKKSIQDGTKNTTSTFTTEESKINTDYLMTQLKGKGYDPQQTTETTIPEDNIFSVKDQQVAIKGGEISVFQYGPEQKGLKEKDLTSIKDNGYNINGRQIKWPNKPYIYSDGTLVVIYYGTDASIATSLSQILGNPLFK